MTKRLPGYSLAQPRNFTVSHITVRPASSEDVPGYVKSNEVKEQIFSQSAGIIAYTQSQH